MTVIIDDLGNLNGSTYNLQTQASGLNNRGEVVGSSTEVTVLSGAFSWRDDVMSPIGPGPTMIGDITTNVASFASAVNDSGEIAGSTYLTSANLSSVPVGVIWQGPTMTYLPTLGGTEDAAYAINASGQVVGTSNNHAVLWQNGMVTDLSAGAAASTSSHALGINASGTVVGYVSHPDPNSSNSVITDAAIWQNGSLTILGSDAGEARGINAQGAVVGDGGYPETAFLWQNGTLTDLAPLTTGLGAQADAINDAGWIVGKAQVKEGAPFFLTINHAMLWENGTGIDLNSLLPANSGWVLNEAMGINDKDQIVGYGTDQGESAAFLLTINGGVTWTRSVSGALALPQLGYAGGGIGIVDSAGNVQNGLDSLQKLAEAGRLSSVTLTDAGTPALTVSATQLTTDAAALNDIGSAYVLTVTAGSATEAIAGIGGHGTIVDFAGSASSYAVTDNAGQLVVTQDNASYDLLGVTALHFNDVTEIVADAPSKGIVTTGNIAELYGAAFGREPDIAGLAFYQNYLATNPTTSLQQFAEWFLASPEYTAAHIYAQSSAGDTQFITDSYQNLLHRVPESGAIPYYQNVINGYTQGLTPDTTAYQAAQAEGHAMVLVYFSTSSEFLSDVQITAQNTANVQHWLIIA